MIFLKTYDFYDDFYRLDLLLFFFTPTLQQRSKTLAQYS